MPHSEAVATVGLWRQRGIEAIGDANASNADASAAGGIAVKGRRETGGLPEDDGGMAVHQAASCSVDLGVPLADADSSCACCWTEHQLKKGD